MISVLIMLALVSLLIIAHELGHFFVAKRCGVRVERFGFGLPFGPTLWKKKIGGTEYCLHALLFGGYVAFPDDNPESDIPKNSPERFENQPVRNRFAIAVAGVTVNALLGWLIMVFVIMGWGFPVIQEGENVQIVQTTSLDSPAAKAGIHANDIVVAIDGKPISAIPKLKRLSAVSEGIHQHVKTPVVLTLLRKEGHPAVSHEVTLSVQPDAKGMIGIQLIQGEYKFIPQHNLLQAAIQSAEYLSTFIQMQFEALGRMASGHMDPSQLSGPISIVNVGSRMIERNGIQEGLRLTAIISVILAVMNLLPIPALDGGHILFLAIELLKGSPVKKEVQERFVQAGFVGLLALMAFVLWNDINNTWIHPISLPK